MNKALFLDRDGTIIEQIYNAEEGTIDIVTRADQIRLLFGITEILQKAQILGYKLIIISNQPGIGLGKLTNIQFESISEAIKQQLQAKNISIDASYYCFHHPYAKLSQYQVVCTCRKPKPGMLRHAAREQNIDLSQSFFLGDGVNDVKAGNACSVKTILLANLTEAGYLTILEKELAGIKPTYMIKKLPEVIPILESKPI